MPVEGRAIDEAVAEAEVAQTQPTSETQSPIVKGSESPAAPRVEFQNFQPFQAERANFEAMLASRGMQMEVSTGRGVTVGKEVTTVPGLNNVVNEQMAVEQQGQGLDIRLKGADGRSLSQDQVNALMSEPAFKASLDRLTESARSELAQSENRRAFERAVNGPSWGERILTKGKGVLGRLVAKFNGHKEALGARWQTEQAQTGEAWKQDTETLKGLMGKGLEGVNSAIAWGKEGIMGVWNEGRRHVNSAQEKWNKFWDARQTARTYGLQQKLNLSDQDHRAHMNWYYPRQERLIQQADNLFGKQEGFSDEWIDLATQINENNQKIQDLELALRYCGERPEKDTDIKNLENQNLKLQLKLKTAEKRMNGARAQSEAVQNRLQELHAARQQFGIIAPALQDQPRTIAANPAYEGPEVPANYQAPSPLMPPVRQEPPAPVYSAPFTSGEQKTAEVIATTAGGPPPTVPEQQLPLAA